MSVIETTTFRLVDGADEAAFLAADRRVQTEFAYQQPGIIRRTTGRGGTHAGDRWLVLTLWASEAHAETSAALGEESTTVRSLLSFVDADSVEVCRYADLG